MIPRPHQCGDVAVLGLGEPASIATAVVSFWAFGSPITLPFTGAIWFAIFLALTAATGAQSVVAAHPANANRISVLGLENWPYWALPMALTSIAVLLLPLGPSPVIQLAAIALSGALIALAYAGLYATVEPGAPGSRRARLLLDSLAYGSALLLFLFVYQTRTRSLLSGTLVAATAMLLAIEILRSVTPRARVALVYGGIVGLVLGEVTWALNYCAAGLTGGLLLLLIFYLLIGIAQHGLQGRLTRRVMIEFAVFAVVALILIALVGPGFTLTVS